jgi:F-type H+-transporting ATPase subunit alpha
VLIIFAGTQGYLDDLPVEQVRKFEEDLYRFADNAHGALLAKIVEKKALDDALRGEIQAMLKEFKERFVAEHPAATAHA